MKHILQFSLILLTIIFSTNGMQQQITDQEFCKQMRQALSQDTEKIIDSYLEPDYPLTLTGRLEEIYNKLEKISDFPLFVQPPIKLDLSTDATPIYTYTTQDLKAWLIKIKALYGIKEKTIEFKAVGHNFTTIPDEIGIFPNLRKLCLLFTKTTTLSSTIKNLKYLEYLQVSHNKLKTLPEEIAMLKNLKKLFLFQNLLTKLPPNFEKLKKLEILNLRDNNFQETPTNLGDIPSLRKIDLASNPITTIPGSLSRLINLESLDLWKTPVSTIEPEFWNIPNLQTLFLLGCPLDRSQHQTMRNLLPSCDIRL